MNRTAIAACLLQLCGLVAVANDDGPDLYSTDWLTPPISLAGERQGICAIDLQIQQEAADRWSGTMTLYVGRPVFNQFGDADKDRLETRKLPLTFRKSTALPDPELDRKPHSGSTVLYVPAGQAALTGVRLVLNPVQPADCRLLIVGPEGRVVRALPLQSNRLRRQAELHPRSDPADLDLKSDYFIGYENRLNTITITVDSGDLTVVHDRNGMSLDRLGNLALMTMMAFHPWSCSLHEVSAPDPTGEERRLFRCELGPGKHSTKRKDNRIETDFDDAFLVLNPREGGWHRLLLRTDGQIDRVLPMYSQRLHSWLLVKSQLKEAAEERVFERISQEVPYFSGFMFNDGRLNRARIELPAGNEALLEYLADLPHLTELEIHGDVVDGAPLERFTRLERLHVSQGRVTEKALGHVGRVPRLKSLSTRASRVDCRGLKHLSGLRELTRFSFRRGDDGNFAEHYDDSCVSVFSALPKLEELDLSAMPLTAAAVAHLPTSQRLTSVEFGYRVPFSAVLRYSQSVPGARIVLGSVDWRLADSAIRLPRSVTNDDLMELNGVGNLQSLSMDGADAITDAGLAHLTSLPLKQLDLFHARGVTDAGVAHIAKIKTLESLNLWYCEKITSDAIADLKRLPNLKKIQLTGTKIDRQLFRAALPRCEIEQ